MNDTRVVSQMGRPHTTRKPTKTEVSKVTAMKRRWQFLMLLDPSGRRSGRFNNTAAAEKIAGWLLAAYDIVRVSQTRDSPCTTAKLQALKRTENQDIGFRKWLLQFTSMTTRTEMEIADCDTRAPICDQLEDERLNVLQIMAVKQLHPTYERIRDPEPMRRRLGPEGAVRAAILYGQCRGKGVINLLTRTRNTLVTAKQKEAFRNGFRCASMIGDKTTELSTLGKTNYAAGSRLLEPFAASKHKAIVKKLAVRKGAANRERHTVVNDLQAVPGYGIFVAKNIAACLHECGLVNFVSSTHHENPALGTNPVKLCRVVRDAKIGKTAAASSQDIETANNIFEHARDALKQFDLGKHNEPLASTDCLALNSCKAFSVLDDFVSCRVQKPRLWRKGRRMVRKRPAFSADKARKRLRTSS